MNTPDPHPRHGPAEHPGHPLRYLSRYARGVVIGLVCLLVTNGLAQAIPWIIKRTIEAMERGALDVVKLQVTLVAGLAVGQAVVRVLSRILIFNAGRAAEYDLRRSAFARLCRLGDDFFQAHRTGDLISRLTNDLSSVRALYGAGVLHVGNTLFAYAIALPLMIRIDPWLTLAGLSPYPLLLFGARTFARGIYSRSHDQQEALAAMSATVEESLAGIREIKSYHLEPQRAQALASVSSHYLDQAIRLARWRAGLLPIVGLGAGLSLVIVLWLGGRKIIAGELSLGSLVAFTLYIGMLAWPTISIGWILSLWQRGISAWHRIVEVLDARSALQVSEEADAEDGPPSPGSPSVETRQLSVRRSGVEVLSEVSVCLEPGTLCAIVGRVGTGKTTLVEALARLVEVPPASYYVAGEDVTERPVSWTRRLVAYAPQAAFLFSRSVRDNIAYGLDPDHGLSPAEVDDRVRRAAQMAGLKPDLAALPDGIETLVGERGYSLSGGQRQRVALARALISTCPIIILDDALSAVDADTEREILNALREALAGRTTLLVSHRLSALQLADQVLVIDRGRIAEAGSHEALLLEGGLYAELYRRQLLEAELSR